jgi:tripartite-type tricarboxylate transporter receptor subunit TctC
VTIIVPFPPGGSTTVLARIVADKLAEMLGKPVVVDYRAGAGGSIAARQVAHSTPDGYTLLIAFSATLAISPAIYGNIGYDPRADFAPIGMIGIAPTVLVVHPSLPAHSVADLIALAKAKPGAIQFGSASIGTVNHLAAELFASMAGIKLAHIPYKGSGPALSDLIGGHIAMMFAPVPAAHANVTAGTLRALAVTSLHRTTLMPDIPTMVEAGLPGYEATQRSVLLAPAGTPRPIVERLNRDLNALLAGDDVKRRLELEGAEPIPGAPEEYAADVEREQERWSRLVRAIGIKPE